MEKKQDKIIPSESITSPSETNTDQSAIQQSSNSTAEEEIKIKKRQFEELDNSIRTIRKALTTLPTSVMGDELTKTFYAYAMTLIAAETKARDIVFRELSLPPGDLENPPS